MIVLHSYPTMSSHAAKRSAWNDLVSFYIFAVNMIKIAKLGFDVLSDFHLHDSSATALSQQNEFRYNFPKPKPSISIE